LWRWRPWMGCIVGADAYNLRAMCHLGRHHSAVCLFRVSGSADFPYEPVSVKRQAYRRKQDEPVLDCAITGRDR